MADHQVEIDLYYDGDWNPAPAYVRDGITLSRGARGEGQDSPPSAATLTLDNRDGTYSPTNPTSSIYGLVGRNTPMRVSADGSVRSVTEVASWAPNRSVDQVDAWTQVEGGGILRRIQQGSTPLRSALERAITASNPVAFWPLNDDKGATSLLSGVEGGTALVIDGATPGAVEGPAWFGSSFVDVASSGAAVSARGLIPSGLPETGWAVSFMTYIGKPTAAGDTPDLVVLQWPVAGDTWKVFIGEDSSSGPYVIFTGNIGTTDASVYRITGLDRGWQFVYLSVHQEFGDVILQLYVNGTNTSNASGNNDFLVIAGTLGAPSGDLIVGQLSPPVTAEYMDAASVGMLAFYALADAEDHYEAFTGYDGEAAGTRFLRVCGEEGVTASVVGTASDSQAMGPQPRDTFVNVLRECVRTDDGLLFEPVDDRGLVMRTGRSLGNQAVTLTLNLRSKQIAPGLAPVLDDQNTRNDVTAVRRFGGNARAIRESGPMNVSDPLDDPQGIGRADAQIQVNPETDDALIQHATWHLHKGTVDEARYPQITVDLDAAPDLVDDIASLELGDRLAVVGLPTDWQQGDASLLVIGIRESFPGGAGDYRRLVTLTTVPASPYEVTVAGNVAGAIDLRGAAVDTDLSTLASGVTSSGTSLSVATTGGILWTTTASDWNTSLNGGGLFITVGGETMRVTNITGASSPQTFTVVRSVNAVTKAHSAGAAVHVRYPARAGL